MKSIIINVLFLSSILIGISVKAGEVKFDSESSSMRTITYQTHSNPYVKVDGSKYLILDTIESRDGFCAIKGATWDKELNPLSSGYKEVESDEKVKYGKLSSQGIFLGLEENVATFSNSIYLIGTVVCKK